jgi:hypothetical protein
MVWVKASGAFLALINISQHNNAHGMAVAISGNALGNCFFAAFNYRFPAFSGEMAVYLEYGFIKLLL